MSEVLLDANVIVGVLDETDSLNERANALTLRLENEGHQPVFADFLLAEALSALCRRAFERKRSSLDLDAIVAWIEEQRERGLVYFPVLTEQTFSEALALVRSSRGELNFNDARVVVMQRNGEIGDVASFDADFASIKGFKLIS